MKVALTDFSAEALQANLDLVVARVMELQHHRNTAMPVCDDVALDYAKTFPKEETEYNHLCLWRVQLLNAIGFVGMNGIMEFVDSISE